MMLLEAVGEPDPETAAAVAEIVARCVPWSRLHVGAALSNGWFGAWRTNGDAFRGEILISTEPGHRVAIETAHHEVWHAIESLLASEALAAVAAMAAGGQFMPGDYLADPAERRARLYAALAAAWDGGLRLSVGPGDRAIGVMHAVYSGRVASEVVAARAKASRPRSRLRRVFDAVVN